MQTLEDLPPDQRAVLSLVLVQGRSYDQIAAALSIDRASVRERARAALDRLSPGSDVPEPQRALLTDYLLGQLPERAATQIGERAARPGPEQAWVQAVSEQLQTLGLRRPAPTMGAAAKPVSRRGGVVLLAGVGLLVLAGIAAGAVALIGENSSSSRDGGPSSAPAAATHPPLAPLGTGATRTTTTTAAPRVLARLAMLPPRAVPGRHTAGIAEVVRSAGRTGIVVVAQGLSPNTSHNAYAVWLTGAGGAGAFLGFVSQLVSANGRLTAYGALPAGAARYSRVLLTLETQSKPKLPGQIVLQGDLALG